MGSDAHLVDRRDDRITRCFAYLLDALIKAKVFRCLDMVNFARLFTGGFTRVFTTYGNSRMSRVDTTIFFIFFRRCADPPTPTVDTPSLAWASSVLMSCAMAHVVMRRSNFHAQSKRCAFDARTLVYCMLASSWHLNVMLTAAAHSHSLLGLP